MNRKDFLKRLPAHDGREPVAAPERELPRPAPLDQESRLTLFLRRLEELEVEAVVCQTMADARRAVEQLREERGWSKVACAPGNRWGGIATAAWTDDAQDAPFGLSLADWGIARTGTVVLRHEGEARRGLSLLPPTTGFFVHASDLVDCLGDVLGALDADAHRLPTAVTFISGPSNTADIASVRCVGVHGPVEVYVWIISEVTRA